MKKCTATNRSVGITKGTFKYHMSLREGVCSNR